MRVTKSRFAKFQRDFNVFVPILIGRKGGGEEEESGLRREVSRKRVSQ
jgi:hypothetical protein